MSLLDLKCQETDCWNFRLAGYTVSGYAVCRQHLPSWTRPERFTPQQKAEYLRQLAEKEKGDADGVA